MHSRQTQIAPGVCLVHTMSSTLIIPDRTVPCSQWVSFTGDNEPVLNSAPEVDEGCDTFLKRLQRSKLRSPYDSCLPSGQQFCFEAVVDKRYNRWKRRRRKKNSERRQPAVLHSSGSSDENDERNAVMEKIIDNMYEQIHGPVPHTPNGSRDTPRMRNRRRREMESSTNLVSGDDRDVDPSSTNYDASSSASSTDAFRIRSGSGRHTAYGSPPSVKANELTGTSSPLGHRIRPEASDSCATSEDMCAWSYMEQYKQEIFRRLKDTPVEQLDQKAWLPDLGNNYDDEADDNDNDNDDGEEYENRELEEDEDNLVDDGCCEEEVNDDDGDDEIVNETETFTATPEDDVVISMTVSPKPEASRSRRICQEVAKSQTLDSGPQHIIDPSRQQYSYAKWSRMNNAKSKKTTPDFPAQVSGPQPVVRSSNISWGEIGTDPKPCPPLVESSKDTQTQGFNAPQRKDSLFSSGGVKRSKELYTTKKQNINLPSLGKNAKSQTIPVVLPRKNSIPSKQDRVSKSSDPLSSKDLSVRTLPPPRGRESSGVRGSEVKATPMVTDFLFRDHYLRQLYGNKVRVNSHVESYKNDYMQFL